MTSLKWRKIVPQQVVHPHLLSGYLTMMGKFDEAQEILVEAWNLCPYADVIVQDYLHHNSAVFHIRQSNFQKASEILNNKEQLIGLMGNIDEGQVIRCQINTWRDKGKIAFKQQQFAEAEDIYQKVLMASDGIGWYRAYCYTCNILANINIDLGNFEKAQSYLEKGLPIAERNRNKRRIAYYKCSQAKIEMCTGNINLARELATEAGIIFIRLGMKHEIEEIPNLFDICIIQ
jgi:tetratricopeptide (TPR) repeat protein